MMNKVDIVKRVACWNCKKNIANIALIALFVFLVFSFAVGSSYTLGEIFHIYLSGFQDINYITMFWIWLHIPIEGILFSFLMDTADKTYNLRLLKFRDKKIYVFSSIISILPLLMVYYSIGYTALVIMYGAENLKNLLWLAALTIMESLSIVLVSFLLSLTIKSYENITFPLVIIIELINCCICAEKKGILRFLPFTQSKMVLQNGYFDNGISLTTSVFYFLIIVIILTAIWLKKDGRSRL